MCNGTRWERNNIHKWGFYSCEAFCTLKVSISSTHCHISCLLTVSELAKLKYEDFCTGERNDICVPAWSMLHLMHKSYWNFLHFFLLLLWFKIPEAEKILCKCLYLDQIMIMITCPSYQLYIINIPLYTWTSSDTYYSVSGWSPDVIR